MRENDLDDGQLKTRHKLVCSTEKRPDRHAAGTVRALREGDEDTDAPNPVRQSADVPVA